MHFWNLYRLTVYAVASLVLGCAVIITSLVNTPARLSGATDFPAFYNAGRIARTEPTRLYDPALQRQMFSDVAPEIDPALVPYYAYTPFFALIFVPLSTLPYPVAFAAWIELCFGMLLFGLKLVRRVTDLPSEYFKSAAIISVCFLPFYAWCLFMGQTTAFAFLAIAVAIYLEREDRAFLSGLALSLLLYKPPLLILILPMLLITKRWRTVAGFALGGTALGLLSLALIRPSGVPAYLAMMRSFANKKQGLAGLTNIEVDAYSFFVNLTHGNMRLANVLFAILLVAAGYWLIKTWRHNPQHAWITAITWTCVLNYYVLLYDSTLAILSVVLLIGTQGQVSKPLRWLMITLFVVPWFHGPMSRAWGFQPMTVMLVAFGSYQLYALTRWQAKRIFVVQVGVNSVPSI